MLEHAGRDLRDQFAYRLSLSDDSKLLALHAMFGRSFGFVVFGSAKPEQLEGMAAEL